MDMFLRYSCVALSSFSEFMEAIVGANSCWLLAEERKIATFSDSYSVDPFANKRESWDST